MPCVFVHALIRIYPHGACIGQSERPAGNQPVLNQIVNQSLAKLELQGFPEPALSDIQYEQTSADYSEDPELMQELAEVLMRQRVVERLIPVIELNLAV